MDMNFHKIFVQALDVSKLRKKKRRNSSTILMEPSRLIPLHHRRYSLKLFLKNYQIYQQEEQCS